MSPEEIARLVANHEQLLNNGRFVRKDIYELHLKNVEKDIGEINDSIRWALRLVVAQFLGLIVMLVVVIATVRGV